MLYSVGHSRHIGCIAESADIDVEGRRGLVRIGIVNEQSLELVGEANDPVGTIVD